MLERIFVQDLNNVLFTIIKNEVAGDKSFDDRCTGVLSHDQCLDASEFTWFPDEGNI